MKQKRIKTKKYVSEDTKQIRSLIIITLVVLAVAVGLYFLTDMIVGKKANTNNVDFDYSAATVGTMFNRPYDEYYVFLYDSTSDEASTYNSLITSYISSEDSIKLYFVDLSMNLDSKYLSDSSNKKPANPSEVKIKDSALVLIKDGKVSKYYESLEEYQKVLK